MDKGLRMFARIWLITAMGFLLIYCCFRFMESDIVIEELAETSHMVVVDKYHIPGDDECFGLQFISIYGDRTEVSSCDREYFRQFEIGALVTVTHYEGIIYEIRKGVTGD